MRGRLEGGPLNDSNRNLPRIPPRRWCIGSVLTWQNLLAEITYSRVSAQDDTAAGELPTEAYDDLRLHLPYQFSFEGNPLELFITGRNLTDDEQRYHSSFIKDFAPQPGRTVEAGVTCRF